MAWETPASSPGAPGASPKPPRRSTEGSTTASREITNTQSPRTMTAPWVFAITGASGGPYAVRLLQTLAKNQVPLQLIISRHGWRLLELESGLKSDAELKRATGGDWSSVEVFDDADRGAAPASGSSKVAGMVICPCSMGTVSAIAHGSSRSLIERAADVQLKERRKLLLVPRETPLSLVHLRNLTAATEAGATVIPAAPGFYHQPKNVSELVDFMVQRIVDHMGVDIEVAPRWKG
jgi:flavin prenyltransferase